MIPFSKIGQFRNIVKDMSYINVNHGVQQLTFQGTVKLHGTNAAVGYKDGKIWYQSRSQVITSENDNYGFVAAQSEYQRDWIKFLCSIDRDDVIVHGEWCGKGIQKGVAIAELPKMFVIFKVTVKGVDMPVDCVNKMAIPPNVHFIIDFPTYTVQIDTEFPGKSSNELATITDEVENECPVGKHFGVSSVGEGVVWKCTNPDYSNLIFKVKGQKHSVSKVKKIASVDTELLASIEEFVNYAATDERLEQGVKEVGLDQKLFGNYMKWVMTDIHTEESDVLEKNGLVMKQVSKALSNRARKFYLNKLDMV
jgi:hypothetical protein